MNNLFVTCLDNIATIPDKVDAVFVINQEITPEQIASIVHGDQIKRLIIVSTHAPFPNEHHNFRILLEPARFWWIPMSWLLTDSEMEGCDDQAVGELAAGNKCLDMGAFYRRSRYLRNELAARLLAQHVCWNLCYAAEDIGVARDAWADAIPLNQSKYTQRSLFSRITSRVKSMQNIPKIQIIEDEFECYAFIGDTRRLRFRDSARVRAMKAPLLLSLREESEISILKRLVTSAGMVSGEKKFRVATSVHNYSPWMLEAFPELRVFVDGLHPPNYPISYGAGYRGSLVVYREECDRQWFEKCGCNVLPPPHILAQERDYGDPCRPRHIHNVCLMLNHAGDWSALIDRSDTDFVIMAFADAAAKAPQFSFRVRPHPTMSMVEHEGIRSYERLSKWISGINLPNMEFSQSSIEEDQTWTDCCVSEYSNVLVDCMKADKACIALNPTNRRNFLKHLEPLGLQVVHNGDELADLLVGLSSNINHDAFY